MTMGSQVLYSLGILLLRDCECIGNKCWSLEVGNQSCYPCFFDYSLFDVGKLTSVLSFKSFLSNRGFSNFPYLKARIPFVQTIVLFRFLKK